MRTALARRLQPPGSTRGDGRGQLRSPSHAIGARPNDVHPRDALGAERHGGVNCSVVLPPFFDAGAAAADRTRVHHGTMHPKLWLLVFDKGGPASLDGGGGGGGFLRLVISS